MKLKRRSHYAARPGFRIAELQISPTQMIPWHYHSDVQDTFYIIN
jgi:quercetin dioxygenase-like cupin family protein